MYGNHEGTQVSTTLLSLLKESACKGEYAKLRDFTFEQSMKYNQKYGPLHKKQKFIFVIYMRLSYH